MKVGEEDEGWLEEVREKECLGNIGASGKPSLTRPCLFELV